VQRQSAVTVSVVASEVRSPPGACRSLVEARRAAKAGSGTARIVKLEGIKLIVTVLLSVISATGVAAWKWYHSAKHQRLAVQRRAMREALTAEPSTDRHNAINLNSPEGYKCPSGYAVASFNLGMNFSGSFDCIKVRPLLH